MALINLWLLELETHCLVVPAWQLPHHLAVGYKFRRLVPTPYLHNQNLHFNKICRERDAVYSLRSTCLSTGVPGHAGGWE